MNSKNVNFCNLLVLLHVKLLVTIRTLNFPDHYSCSPWAGGGWRTNQLFAVRELLEIENLSFLVRLRSAGIRLASAALNLLLLRVCSWSRLGWNLTATDITTFTFILALDWWQLNNISRIIIVSVRYVI